MSGMHSACQTAGMTPASAWPTARLYLVCDARPRAFLDAALRGGVDLVQLRDKTLDDDGLSPRRATFRAAADAHGALFILNDRPDLVEACGADGVHVGQDDGTPAAARAAVGPDRIVGRSTHAPAQADAARRRPRRRLPRGRPGARDADQAGPPGRRAATTSRYAASTVRQAVVRDRRARRRQRARGRRARRDADRRRARDHRRRRPRGRGARAARRAGGAGWAAQP